MGGLSEIWAVNYMNGFDDYMLAIVDLVLRVVFEVCEIGR